MDFALNGCALVLGYNQGIACDLQKINYIVFQFLLGRPSKGLPP